MKYEVILQTARIYSLALIYAFGGRSAVGAYAEYVIGVQYKFTSQFKRDLKLAKNRGKILINFSM